MKQTLYILLIFTLMVASAVGAYKYAGPYIDFDPPQSLNLLRSGGLFISINGGDSWVKADVKGGSFNDLLVNDLEYYIKEDSLIIFLAGLNGVYQSVDNGLTWSRVFSDNIKREVFDIAVDDSQMPGVLYIATENKEGRGVILRSADGGVTFDTIFSLSTRGEKIIGVATDIIQRKNIFGLTNKGSFLQSLDSGKSWSKIEISNTKFNRLVVDPRDSSIIYAVTNEAGFFRSIDRGASWKNLRSSLRSFSGSQKMYDLSVSPLLSSTFYIATDFGILRSRDRGSTFSEVPFLIPTRSIAITAIEADAHSLSSVYAGVKNQVYKTTDAAATWQVSVIDTSGTVNYISVNITNSDIIYAGIEDGF